MQYLRSLLFTTFLFASTLCYAAVVISVGTFLPHRRRFFIVRLWARTELAALRVLCGLDYVVEGGEHVPQGAHVSYWKHSSAWETIAQVLVFPPQAWVAKRELLWMPLVGWGVHLMRPILIDRRAGGSAVNQVVSQGRERLAQGLWVLVFPEGTRVAVGKTARFGISGALLAAQTGCLVVPVAHNAGLYWARRGLLKKRGTIRVVIGAPIAGRGRDAREINEEARRWIDATVARLGA